MNILPSPNSEADPAMVSMLTRGAKITAGAVVAGVIGFAAARGIEQYLIPMDSNHAELYEATISLTSAGAVGFLISEIID